MKIDYEVNVVTGAGCHRPVFVIEPMKPLGATTPQAIDAVTYTVNVTGDGHGAVVVGLPYGTEFEVADDGVVRVFKPLVSDEEDAALEEEPAAQAHARHLDIAEYRERAGTQAPVVLPPESVLPPAYAAPEQEEARPDQVRGGETEESAREKLRRLRLERGISPRQAVNENNDDLDEPNG